MTANEINSLLSNDIKYDQQLTIQTGGRTVTFEADDTDPIIFVIRGMLENKLTEMRGGE